MMNIPKRILNKSKKRSENYQKLLSVFCENLQKYDKTKKTPEIELPYKVQAINLIKSFRRRGYINAMYEPVLVNFGKYV